jgi:hypothetical protein
MPSWPWTFATLPAGNVAASKLDDNFNAAMFAAGSSTNGAVPTWNGTGGNALNTGGLSLGGSPNNIPQVTSAGLLPSGIGAAQAYVSFTAAGAIFYALNVASVTKTGTGTYDVTFTNGPPSTTYVAIAGTVASGPGLIAVIINKTASIVTVGSANTVSQAYQDGNCDLVCFW